MEWLSRWWWTFLVVPLAIGGAFGVYRTWTSIRDGIVTATTDKIYANLLKMEANEFKKTLKEVQEATAELEAATQKMNEARQQISKDAASVREAGRGKENGDIAPVMKATLDAMAAVEQKEKSK